MSVKILILNRRDIKNPAGGGAEVYTHEAAKGLLSLPAEVTVFSSRFKSAPEREVVDGVTYLRAGNELTVHFRGFLHALRNRRRFDLMIDQFNGMGFFCFVFPKSILLIHQMYREFWFRELGVFGALPYVFEPLLLGCYRKRPAITVSDSTKKDLEALGFRDVRIVMNALGEAPLREVPEKEKSPTLVFLGRLRATKKPADAIEIFRLIKAEVKDARLWMIGAGPEEAALRKTAQGIGGVTFHGWLDAERKFELLGRSHILLVPGVREGFGINVLEAASRGTPAVGYDIHGLRDSIKDGVTGLLAKGPEDAAGKAAALLRNPALLGEMAGNCLKYARGFNWQGRAEEFRKAVRDAAAGN